LPTFQRRERLAAFHQRIVGEYLRALDRVDSVQSARTGVDGRTIAQVVGHIAEWERWAILAVSELLAGADWPRLMDLRAYPADDSFARDFDGQDQFNAYQANLQAIWPWERVRAVAVAQATSLFGLLACPGVLPLHRIEHSRRYSWHLDDGRQWDLPCGWYLWLVSLEHEAVDHAMDLYG
jgi:hypothetical protein